jgi:L-fuculose-phosphate aldolase
MSDASRAARKALIAAAHAMCAAGLNRGTAGNLSCRHHAAGREGFLITPSGVAYERLLPESLAWIDLRDGQASGPLTPSSEWRLHYDLYLDKPGVGAVLHTHSPFAVSLAARRLEIPPFHYMIARFGGDTVRCAAYALFGTQALSDAALRALAERSACLLANHGMLTHGRDLQEALLHAVELEALCEQYWRCLQIGGPILLTPQEMAAARQRFQTYGQSSADGK